MKKLSHLIIVSIVCSLLFCTAGGISHVRADELDDINAELAKLQNDLDSSRKATKPLEENLNQLRTQIASLRNRITDIEVNVAAKEKEIGRAERALIKQKEIINERISAHYKNIRRTGTSMVDLLVTTNLSQSLQSLFYQKKAADNDKQTIIRIVLYIKNIDDAKRNLTSEKARLAQVKTKIDTDSAFLSGEVDKARTYQSNLTGKIADLTAKQQEIMAARSGSFTFSGGSGDLADEHIASIEGFRESAPGGYFGIFSFGAYTHRKGMSQYGARGRAEKGASAKDILKAYYNKEPVGKDTNGNIKVAGNGEIDFETTYLYGIAEMPSSWHIEALKAQAIAARTYAYRFKQDDTEICITESCQVFNKSKSDNPPESWKKAVDETKGQVLEDVVTFFSSTTGGYLTTKGWDTTDGNGGSNFIDKTYEKFANSPWLYKTWWRQGYTSSGNTCGRSNPWLSPSELADIVNAALALKTGGIDTSRITPLTTSCWGGDPYSMDELRGLTGGKGISSATSVSVSQGDGVTNSVTVNGISFSGLEFKRAVCLRAPGYIRIPQSSCDGGWAFYNIERK